MASRSLAQRLGQLSFGSTQPNGLRDNHLCDADDLVSQTFELRVWPSAIGLREPSALVQTQVYNTTVLRRLRFGPVLPTASFCLPCFSPSAAIRSE